MPALTVIDHQILYKDPFAYCAHPFIAALPNGKWVVVFNRSVRRPFLLHPPNDPHYYNVMIRSTGHPQFNGVKVAQAAIVTGAA